MGVFVGGKLLDPDDELVELCEPRDDRVKLGDPVGVFDKLELAVIVLLTCAVFVPLLVEVDVVDPILYVMTGDADGVFESIELSVGLLVGNTVCDPNPDGVRRREMILDCVLPEVRVEVLDEVADKVGTKGI